MADPKQSTYVTPKTKNHQRVARASSFSRLAKMRRARAKDLRQQAKVAVHPSDQRDLKLRSLILRDIAADEVKEAKALRAMR